MRPLSRQDLRTRVRGGNGASARLVALALAALVILPGGAPLARSALRGAATVSDGDTLKIGGANIRLFGIDAPEKAQRCGAWACGTASKARLAELVAGHEIACVIRDVDKYGRKVATCRAGDTDLAGALVDEGLAWAFTRYSAEYAPVEAAARDAGVGIWRGAAKAPWEYRADLKAEQGRVADAKSAKEAGDCRIKGNISVSGDRIYHIPGTATYARVRISTGKGERWFCDETAAVAAGWRAVRG